jgi:cell wall-associated NlpC family hydrolase
MLVILAVAACQSAAVSYADPAPTPTPTTAEQVQTAKDAADRQVAQTARSIKQEARNIAALSASAARAEQSFIAQQRVQARANFNATMATMRLAIARGQYHAAYTEMAQIAVASYESGGSPGSISTSSIGSLLIVDNPGAVLSAEDQQQMLADHQATIVSRMTVAVEAVRTATLAQHTALAAVTAETSRLDSIRRDADTALTEAAAALKHLQARLTKVKATQKQADAALSTFLGGWSAADPARASALNSHYEAIALQVSHAKPAPRSSHWTAAMGQTAVNRALQYLGTPYAWAGGTSSGPTRGVCAGGGANNDCHLTGFDCSGLALYGWAPYLSMTHNAAVQYGYGHVHPAITALLPGDLVFWSDSHAVASIHHVAIYIGNGNVIQAPQSGDIVRITPLGSVSSGYFGATRPLS